MTARRTCRAELPKIVGKQRPRFVNGRAYTPKATKEAERAIRTAWLKQVGGAFAGYRGPFRIRVEAYQELPKSAAKRREGEQWVCRPDADNVLKLVVDALNGAAFADDGQCVDMRVVKMPRTAHGMGAWLDIEVEY